MYTRQCEKLGVAILLVLLGCLAACFSPRVARACSTPPPDSWFTEIVRVEATQLPTGVSLTYTTLPYPFLVVTNTSTIPLYILATPDTSITSFPDVPVAVPSGLAPMYKLVDNQAFYWTVKGTTGADSTQFAWQPIDRLEFYIQNNQIGSWSGTILRLDQRNSREPVRPNNVATPFPQQVDLPIIYGEQLAAIPLEVSYQLNQTYNPDVGRHPDPCGYSKTPTASFSSAGASPVAVTPPAIASANEIPEQNSWMLGLLVTSFVGVILVTASVRRRPH